MEAAKKPAPLPTSKAGWLRSEMPAAAELIDDLRRQLGNDIVQGTFRFRYNATAAAFFTTIIGTNLASLP
jgi:hypothetical protein